MNLEEFIKDYNKYANNNPMNQISQISGLKELVN